MQTCTTTRRKLHIRRYFQSPIHIRLRKKQTLKGTQNDTPTVVRGRGRLPVVVLESHESSFWDEDLCVTSRALGFGSWGSAVVVEGVSSTGGGGRGPPTGSPSTASDASLAGGSTTITTRRRPAELVGRNALSS
eukprot:RCo021101